MSSATETEQALCMPTPTSEHKRFEPFAGKFRAEVRMWMGQGDPMIATGTMTNTLELGGIYLQQDYAGDPNDGPFPAFEGKGFWGFNTTTKQYEGFWVDNASNQMQLEKGQIDGTGKVWEMRSEALCAKTGQLMKKRSVIELQDNNHHKMTSYFTGPDGAVMKVMEINYTRVA
jgi:hypothetical protein